MDESDDRADELSKSWSIAFGIAGPEWMILAALSEANPDAGLRADALARRLGVHLSYVTTKAQWLKERGLLRLSIARDPNAMRLWLTEKARSRIPQ